MKRKRKNSSAGKIKKRKFVQGRHIKLGDFVRRGNTYVFCYRNVPPENSPICAAFNLFKYEENVVYIPWNLWRYEIIKPPKLSIPKFLVLVEEAYYGGYLSNLDYVEALAVLQKYKTPDIIKELKK